MRLKFSILERGLKIFYSWSSSCDDAAHARENNHCALNLHKILSAHSRLAHLLRTEEKVANLNIERLCNTHLPLNGLRTVQHEIDYECFNLIPVTGVKFILTIYFP